MRHGRGANFASNGALLEVAQADVAPHISVKVQQHSVESGNDTKQLCNVVMWLNLQAKQVLSECLQLAYKLLAVDS